MAGVDVDGMEEGLNVILVNPLPQHLKCRLCFKLMRNPLQTIRGELACKSCYIGRLGSSGICPIDGEPVTSTEYYRDRFKFREIQRLECFCFFKEYGCSWIGTVYEVEEHMTSCSYLPTRCPLCDCQVFNMSNNHTKDCPYLAQRKFCVFAEYGCRKEVQCVDDHIDHLQDDFFLHSLLQNQYCQEISTQYKHLRNEFDNFKKSSNDKEMEMKRVINNFNEHVASLSNTVTEIQSRLESLLENEKGATNVTTEFVGTESERNENVEKLLETVAAMDKKISDLDLKQQLYENSTSSGNILWKIDNFNFRMQQAVIGRVSTLHSAPCSTEKNGYRFCGRLYLNGDGIGKCTHVSVFFVLMKSQYDNLLQWPFTRRIKFRLINQDNELRSIEETLLPDRFSSSFQKPTRDMNVAAGCPMFVSKEDLISNGFVKDDAIFIEISVV